MRRIAALGLMMGLLLLGCTDTHNIVYETQAHEKYIMRIRLPEQSISYHCEANRYVINTEHRTISISCEATLAASGDPAEWIDFYIEYDKGGRVSIMTVGTSGSESRGSWGDITFD